MSEIDTKQDAIKKPANILGFRYIQYIMLFTILNIAYGIRSILSVAVFAMTESDPPNKNIPTYPEWSKKKNLMLSSFFWGYICLQVIAGQLAKNYGPKRFMSASAFIGSVFCMLIPIFGAYLGYSGVIVCRIITGLSQGFIFPCVHNLLSAWTPIQDRAKIGSFTYAGGPLGTVISLPIAGLISDSSFGWPVVFYVYGALGMLWSVVYFFLGSNSPSQHKSISAEERKYIEHGVPNENMEKVPTPWKSILTSLPFWAILVAHCGQNLGFWTLLTEIPSYMKNILHFEISSNSTLSSLPYLAMWIFSLFMSPMADYLIVKSLTDVRASRKIFNSIGLFVPALTLISLTFVEQSHYILAVVLLTCGVGFNSAVYSGYNVNHIDLSPIHAGTLMGITNTVSNVFSLISPLVVDVVIFFSGFEEIHKRTVIGNCSKHPNQFHEKESFEPPTFMVLFLTQISFYILMFLGYISQELFPPKNTKEKNRDGYQPLFDNFSTFFSRYVYRRVRDCSNYPICSVAGNEVILKERVTKDSGWTFEFTGLEKKCVNLGSFNYLGFAEQSGPHLEAAIASIYKYGISTGNPRQRYGSCELHDQLEQMTAEFLGVEDVITFGMGFATNSLNIPTLLSPGCLVLSDEKNHNSIILGMRLGGATIRVFKHNNVKHLEKHLREAIYYGQPNQVEGSYKSWKKIVIFVEGIYSMEGTIVRLPEIIALKKKYKAYLYIDEAHSIGAVGRNGRGVVDYFHCDPKDVDALMGTYSKSFGSSGGYIAGTKEFITGLREKSFASRYGWTMSPPLASQIISILKILMGRDGTNEGVERIERLARNTQYFRQRLQQMGVVIYGNQDSPIVPILGYHYSKIAVMVRNLIEKKVAMVAIGYPFTTLNKVRIRICLSSGHTKEQLDYALDAIQKAVEEIGLKYSRKPINNLPIDYHKIKIH